MLSTRTKNGQVNGITISDVVKGLNFKVTLPCGRVFEIGYPCMANGKIELNLLVTREGDIGYLIYSDTIEELCIGIEYVKKQCLKFGNKVYSATAFVSSSVEPIQECSLVIN